MAAEYNLDLNDILGTGKDGRVLKEDVIHFMESQALAKKPAAAAPSPPPAAAPKPAAAQPRPVSAPAKPALQPPRPVVTGEDRTEPLKGIMKAMTKTM
jgi:2-oxoisovalerate dehydrogenase E2 component (dihydrolipoyl transacylase)